MRVGTLERLAKPRKPAYPLIIEWKIWRFVRGVFDNTVNNPETMHADEYQVSNPNEYAALLNSGISQLTVDDSIRAYGAESVSAAAGLLDAGLYSGGYFPYVVESVKMAGADVVKKNLESRLDPKEMYYPIRREAKMREIQQGRI